MFIFGHYVCRQMALLCISEIVLFLSIFTLTHLTFAAESFADIPLSATVSITLASSALLVISLIAIGAYKVEARRSIKVMRERLLLGGLVGAAAIMVVEATFGNQLAVTSVIGAVGIACGSAFSLRALARRLEAAGARLQPRALVLGSGEMASALWRLCGERTGTQIVGFIHSPQTEPIPAETLPADRMMTLPADLARQAQQNRIDQIIVAVDDRRGGLPLNLLLDCRMLGIRVLDSVTFLERETGRVDLDTVSPGWLIFSSGFDHGWLGRSLRRLIDLAGSAALLTLFAPVMAAAALAIKLDSPGSVFFTQDRVGRHSRPFRIFKFRSMFQDASKFGHGDWTTDDDPRITRVGRVIRRYRIDELPQLINVLRGEMSLVGPRPEQPRYVRELAEVIPFYNERHRIKPGITGWAQVNHAYTASIEDTRVKLEYDLFYLKNQSTLLYLVTLLQTVRVILQGDGAR